MDLSPGEDLPEGKLTREEDMQKSVSPEGGSSALPTLWTVAFMAGPKMNRVVPSF